MVKFIKRKNYKKTAAFIQARLTSKRFPGKVLKKIDNITLIELLIERLKKSKLLDEIIICIPKNKSNKALKLFLEKRKYKVFCGKENDVLDRYYKAAKKNNVDVIVRITSDCPLIDHKIVDKTLNLFSNSKSDYTSNTFPPSFPDGFDVEIFSFKTLKKVWRNVKSKYDKEHVTTYIKKNYKKFKISNLKNEENLSHYKTSVDYKDDLSIIKRILANLNSDKFVSSKKIMCLLKKSKYFLKNNFSNLKINNNNLISQKLWNNAKEVIPGGNMLFSKRAERFLPNRWPNYFKKAQGCKVWDFEGRELIDLSLMGVGTNILGYANRAIDNAVKKTIDKSNMSTLNSYEEVILAKKLIDIHKWSDMAKFTRTGGEANAVAIRIARAASNKDGVAVCGYHGWHDWYISANLAKKKNLDNHLLPGIVPAGVPKSLANTTFTFEYNNFNQLKKIVNDNPRIGIIKMEVQRNQTPKNKFLQNVRKLATDKKLILIFDECTTGFRETYGGLHLKYKINPDIAIFGKALGNGYAINAIIGKKEYMEFANKTFISSTFWTERIGPTAALKTLEEMKKRRSWLKIKKIGKKIKKKWLSLAKKNKLKISVSGLDSLCSFNFLYKNNKLYKTLITQEMLKRNLLATNTIYVSIEHNEKILKKYFLILDDIFKKIKRCENGENIYNYLETLPPVDDFKRLN